MAKQDHRFIAAGVALPTELRRELAVLGGSGRDDALVRFLAGAEGWQGASRQLSGAFADDEALRLRREQEE